MTPEETERKGAVEKFFTKGRVQTKRFLLCLALVLGVFFVVGGGLLLKKGIYVESLDVGPATLSHLSLQWQKKLNLQVESLVIDSSRDEGGNIKSTQHPDLSAVNIIGPLVRWLDYLFANISVTALEAGDIQGKFLYEESLGHIDLSSPIFVLQAELRLNSGILIADIKKLESEQFQSQASGELRFDLQDKRGSGKLTANFAGSLPVNLELDVDSQQLSFHGKEKGVITTITPFVDLFGLDQNIKRWITEYLTGSRYELKSFKGDFPWENPLHLLESFSAEVRVEGCEYTFAPGLEAIKSAYTDVQFNQGVLSILPHAGRFYGQDTEDSWLDINFNDFENIALTVYIVTHAVGNADIMNLLEYYDIPLPFVQKTGKTGVDLTLGINLNKLEVNTKASFEIEDGIVEYKAKPYRVQNIVVSLLNSKITIEKMRCGSQDIFKADVNGVIDAGASTGDINVVLKELMVPVGNSVLALAQSDTKAELQIQMRANGSRVNASESFWKVGAFSLHLDPFDIPLSFDDCSGKLPSTRLTVQTQVEAALLEVDVAGDFSLQKKQVDLHCTVRKFSAKDIVLTSDGMPIRIEYDNGLIVHNLEKSQWSINTIPVTLFPASISFDNNVLSISSEKVIYGDFVEGAIGGFYDFGMSKGVFFIDKPHFRMEQLSSLLNPESSLIHQIDGSGEHLRILVPGLDLEITTGENSYWSAHFKNLKAAHEYSPLLQQFKLDAGEVRIALPGPGLPYSFTAELPYSYPFLVRDGKPMELYHIRGQVSEGDLRVEINSNLSLRYTDHLEISSEHIAYNIPVIFQFMEECLKPWKVDSAETKTINAVLQGTDSGLYLSADSQLVADTLALSIIDKKMDMELAIGKGSVVANMEGETFSLSGEDLGDTFMNNLLPDAHVKGGRMEMAMQGQFDDFSVLVKVEDTLLEDFKTLNNILAFVNTIPALVTFSLPSYSSSGLQVTSAMAGMKVKKGLATVESMHLESPELNMAGTGWINFPERKVGMDFNLITQTKKNIQKIPLIGYVFAGDKKQPSITVQVSGDLMDPEVESEVFREIVTSPFSILYRTLALPAHLVSPMFTDEEELPVDAESEL